MQEYAHLLIRGRDLGDHVADAGTQGAGLNNFVSSFDFVLNIHDRK